MSDYIHHIPGRLRIRSKNFRCNSSSLNTVRFELSKLKGIASVRLNLKAGSMTVCYDTKIFSSDEILELMNSYQCVSVKHAKPVSNNLAVKQPALKSTKEWNVTKEIGKIAFNVLVSKGVSYSLSSILRTA